MSGGIEEPYTIAALPKPRDDGRILAASVHSLHGSRKRKRHEIAIGVDGESVNIYNVQNQEIVSSYALPPHSRLAAPPCSVYCKRSRPLPPQRQTYIAVRDSPSDRKARLLSIRENLGKPLETEQPPRGPVKKERKLANGRIAGLDIISPSNSTEPEEQSILVSYVDGKIECLSGDLSGSRWELASSTDVEVEYATVVEFEAARKGLLKGSEDILAALDPMTTEGRERNAPSLLFQITRSNEDRHIRLFVLRNVTGQFLQGVRKPLEELLVYDLPSRHATTSETTQYELHAASGTLYQRLATRLTVYDLSGTLPKTSFELGRKGSPRVIGFTRLSSATLLAVSPDRLAVYETKYGSMLSSLTRATHEVAESQTSNILSIVTQFSDLGLVVALSGQSLVAFQMGDILDDGRRAKAHGALLVDVMGKAKYIEAAQPTSDLSHRKEKKRQRWLEWTGKVDRFIQEQDVDGLEALVARDIHLTKAGDATAEEPSVNGMNGEIGSHEAPLWDLPSHTYDPRQLDGKKPAYILGKIFAWRKASALTRRNEHNLEITLLSRNVLRWLAMAGFLNPAQIQRVLPEAAPGYEVTPQVARGDIMVAIFEAEPSFTLMADLLSLPMHWDLAEVLRGLQMFMRKLMDKDPISSDDIQVDYDIAMTNGDNEQSRLEAEVDAAGKQLTQAESALQNTQLISLACRLLLVRLQAFPQKQVSQMMRDILDHDDIDFFIAMLRMELSDGGWTTRYVEQAPPEEEPEEEPDLAELGNAGEHIPSDQGIRTIAHLFSCAIDAVGLSGWLVGRSADVSETLLLIQTLRNEISAAVEGLFELRVIGHLLQEACKTAGQMEQQSQQLKRKWQVDEEEPTAEERLMPLSGRLEPPTLGPKSSKRTSRAAIAEQKSRSIGKYSFERIRF